MSSPGTGPRNISCPGYSVDNLLESSLLAWDYAAIDSVGAAPRSIVTGEPVCFSVDDPIPSRFADVEEYKDTMQKLVTKKAWTRITKVKCGELQEEVRQSTSIVDEASWNTEGEFHGVAEANQAKHLKQCDIVVLHSASQTESLPCLGIITELSRRHQKATIVLRVHPHVTKCLKLDPKCAGFRVELVHPRENLQNELNALLNLPELPLLPDILDRKIREPVDSETEHERNVVMRWYNASPLEASAILNARRSAGFCLIQSAPLDPSGQRTKIIMNILGALLTQDDSGNPKRQPWRRILVCAPTSEAVDSLISEVKAGIASVDGLIYPSFVKLGGQKTTHPDIRMHTLQGFKRQVLNGQWQCNPGVLRRLGDVRRKATELVDKMRANNDGKMTPELRTLSQELDGIRLMNRPEQYSAMREEYGETRIEDCLLLCHRIVFATPASAARLDGIKADFDTVIVDDATEQGCTELTTLMPLRYGCTRCILLSDPDNVNKYSLFTQMAQQNPQRVMKLDGISQLQGRFSFTFFSVSQTRGPIDMLVEVMETLVHELGSVTGRVKVICATPSQAKEVQAALDIRVPDIGLVCETSLSKVEAETEQELVIVNCMCGSRKKSRNPSVEFCKSLLKQARKSKRPYWILGRKRLMMDDFEEWDNVLCSGQARVLNLESGLESLQSEVRKLKKPVQSSGENKSEQETQEVEEDMDDAGFQSHASAEMVTPTESDVSFTSTSIGSDSECDSCSPPSKAASIVSSTAAANPTTPSHHNTPVPSNVSSIYERFAAPEPRYDWSEEPFSAEDFQRSFSKLEPLTGPSSVLRIGGYTNAEWEQMSGRCGYTGEFTDSGYEDSEYCEDEDEMYYEYDDDYDYDYEDHDGKEEEEEESEDTEQEVGSTPQLAAKDLALHNIVQQRQHHGPLCEDDASLMSLGTSWEDLDIKSMGTISSQVGFEWGTVRRK